MTQINITIPTTVVYLLLVLAFLQIFNACAKIYQKFLEIKRNRLRRVHFRGLN